MHAPSDWSTSPQQRIPASDWSTAAPRPLRLVHGIASPALIGLSQLVGLGHVVHGLRLLLHTLGE
eukprot:2510512-Pyramimonas_sp.AAC.1